MTGTNNVYELTVQVTDGEFNATKNLAITVVDVHENDAACQSPHPQPQSVPENTILAMDLNGTDPNGDTLAYSIAYGDDHHRFDLNATSGDTGLYRTARLREPDRRGLEQRLRVDRASDRRRVQRDQEPRDHRGRCPSRTTRPQLLSPATASVPENTILAMDLNGTDPDGDTLVYSIAYGDDHHRFDDEQPPRDALTFLAPPDFENPTFDDDTNNVYELTVQVTDGEFNATRTSR